VTTANIKKHDAAVVGHELDSQCGLVPIEVEIRPLYDLEWTLPSLDEAENRKRLENREKLQPLLDRFLRWGFPRQQVIPPEHFSLAVKCGAEWASIGYDKANACLRAGFHPLTMRAMPKDGEWTIPCNINDNVAFFIETAVSHKSVSVRRYLKVAKSWTGSLYLSLQAGQDGQSVWYSESFGDRRTTDSGPAPRQPADVRLVPASAPDKSLYVDSCIWQAWIATDRRRSLRRCMSLSDSCCHATPSVSLRTAATGRHFSRFSFLRS
jgi:hypothetical protein